MIAVALEEHFYEGGILSIIYIYIYNEYVCVRINICVNVCVCVCVCVGWVGCLLESEK